MKKMKSSPTIKDVASEADVAIGTVSKVINGRPVGDEYRVRVEKAIEKLGYRVNQYAKGLRSDKTYTIAVIVPNLINPYFSALVNEIGKELSKRNYDILLSATDFNLDREQHLVDKAEQKMVDGIICLSYNPQLRVSAAVPFVSIDRYFGEQKPCITSDNFAGGRLAARKLHENGCRNLSFLRIGSPLDNEPNKRRDGFVSYCEEVGLAYNVKYVEDGTPYEEFERFLKEHIHNQTFDFDGLFCVTDSLAWRVIKSLRSFGIRVPEDVQLVGFDGIRYFGDQELICSTIVQPVEAIAKNCVEYVLSDQQLLPSLIQIPVSYAFGGTTKS